MTGTLTYYVAGSIDGRIAHDDGTYAGLLTQGDHVGAFLRDVADFDVVLMGRRTYEIGLAAGVTEGQPVYPDLENVVCTRTMEFVPGAAVTRAEDALEVVRTRKAEGKRIWLCGGGELSASLLDAGAVDEVVLKLNPSLFGSGIPLASRMKARTDLVLRETRVFDSGVVFLRYGCETSEKTA